MQPRVALGRLGQAPARRQPRRRPRSRRCGACRRTPSRGCPARRRASRRAWARRRATRPGARCPRRQRPLRRCRPRRRTRPRTRTAPSPSPTSPVSCSISSPVGSASRGGLSVATTVSSRSSTIVTPSGALTADSRSVSFIAIADASATSDSGISVGSASIVTWWVTWSMTPPSMTPGASSAPCSTSATVAWMATSRRTRSRSMCIGLPADRVMVGGLDHRRRGVAVDREIQHRAAGGQRDAQLASVDVEGDRILAAAVEDAGDPALAAQAARRARARGSTRASVELGGRSLGHGTNDGSGVRAALPGRLRAADGAL